MRKVSTMQLVLSYPFRRLRTDQLGLTTVEYVIVLCLIAAVAVGTWKNFGKTVHDGLVESNKKIGAALGAE